jgi:tetratricopeptide (TPR) repeat protein/TolB-like protein
MAGRGVLEGWKAISAYLGRTGKTCRKWERELGLPVHRLDDSASAHVFAYADELDRWKEEKLQAEKYQPVRSRSRFSRKDRYRLASASIALLVFVAAAAVLLWKVSPSLRSPAAPKIENSIAVISFKNLTGDPAYDNLQEVIPNLVITNLENTGLFYVATMERMRDVLKQMNVKPTRPIDADLGFKFCRREGIKAIAIGSLAKAGDVFSTDVKVLDVQTKALLASASDRGTGVDSILATQIDVLSRRMSLSLGVERTKVEAARMDIKGITTSSLQAYYYFLKAREAYDLESWEDLRKYSEKAVGIDPKFAMAYYFLAYANFFLGDVKARNETLEQAMALADRTSEKDRLYLEGAYAGFVKRDRDRYELLLKEIIGKYPKEEWACHNLGDLYFVKGDYVAACDQYKKWLELDPRDTFVFTHLVMVTTAQRDFKKAQEYIKMREALGPPDTSILFRQAIMYRRMGQLDKAIAVNKEVLRLDPDFWQSIHHLIELYAFKEDYEEAMRWADEFISRASSAGVRSRAYRTRGFYHYWRGEFKDAFADFSHAENMDQEIENWSGKAAEAEWEGIVDVALGEAELGRKSFDAAVRIAEEHVPADVPVHKAQEALWMGYLAIKQGRIDQAQFRLSELESSLTKLDQRTQKELSFWRDLLEGEVLLAQGSLDAALAVSQRACQPGSPFLDDSTYFRDLLARVYAQRGEVDKAVSEYGHLLKPDVSAYVDISEYGHPEEPYGAADVIYLIHPLYHYRLGLLYENAGEVAKARAQHEKFLDLWKNADPGQPEIEDAGKRLKGLEGQ